MHFAGGKPIPLCLSGVHGMRKHMRKLSATPTKTVLVSTCKKMMGFVVYLIWQKPLYEYYNCVTLLEDGVITAYKPHFYRVCAAKKYPRRNKCQGLDWLVMLYIAG